MEAKGKKNKYTCTTCGGYIRTVDRDEGVTPFMIPCLATDGCKGTMQSSGYQVIESEPTTFEWYMPDSVDGLDEATQEHVRKGGLVLRPITGADQAQ